MKIKAISRCNNVLHFLMNTKVEKINNKFIRGMDHCTLKNMNVFKTIANLATLSTSYKKKNSKQGS